MSKSLVASAPPREPVPLRRVFLLCLPALILAIALRISFLVAIPEVYYGADSNSYFDTARHLWTDGTFELKPKRRYFYPLLLTAAPLLPGSVAIGVAVVQHILGLLIIVGVGWIVAQLTRLPTIFVPIATCAVAIWPRMLWYEHEMIAEVWMLAAFVAAVAIALPCGALKDKNRLFWFLVMLATIAACKPHGRPLWLGLMIVAAVTAGNPLKWGIRNLAMVALAVMIMLTAGSNRQGGWLLLNTALPFVNTEGQPYAEYRAILKPFIEEARADLPNYADNQTRYKKALSGKRFLMGSEWVKLSKNKELYSKVTTELAIEGIRSHPLEYGQLVLRKIACTGGRVFAGRFNPEDFWRDQSSHFKASSQDETVSQDEIKLLYGLDRNAYPDFAAERAERTTWLAPELATLSRSLIWTKYRRGQIGEPPTIRLTVLGWLLVIGFAACLMPRDFFCRALLWVPLVLYLLIILGVGDVNQRYLHPVEWAAIVIVVIGLDTIVTFVSRKMRDFGVSWQNRHKPSAAPPSGAAW